MKISLYQIIAIVCILAMALMKHVKNYDVTICTAHGTELSKMHTSTSYYILESADTPQNCATTNRLSVWM